ncbi:MAG: hypothetical protein AAB470_01120 [Patescibacteria group bacterium]
MNTKSLIWIGVFIGSFVGGWIPTLWGAGSFSFSGIIGSTIGGLLGIWGGFKLSNW